MDFTNTTLPDNGSHVINETLDQLDARYAKALVPFAALVGVFCAFGILGNILVMIVFCFSKEYRNTNFKTFVLFLAAIDLLSCIALMPAEIVKTSHYFSFSDDLPCKVKCFFNIFTMTAAALALFVICIDRYRKVCQPLKKQIYPELSWKIMIGVLMLSALLALPAPVMCGVSQVDMDNLYKQTITAYTCAAEEQFEHSIYRKAYKLGMTIILIALSGAFIVMYTLIMRTVIRHWCKRDSSSSIRFEPTGSRSNEFSGEKIEIENLSNHDDVFVPDEKAAVENGNGTTKSSSSTKRMAAKMLSNSSNSSYGNKGRFSVKRHSSDASFRSRVSRRRSSAPGPGKLPYKTIIWFILTLVFLVTYIINAALLFLSTKEHTFSPGILAIYLLFVRLYFVNNMINPIIYSFLDKRFKKSCKELIHLTKSKFCGK